MQLRSTKGQKRSCCWHDATPGVIYEFCRGRGAQYPVAFLDGDEKLGERRWQQQGQGIAAASVVAHRDMCKLDP